MINLILFVSFAFILLLVSPSVLLGNFLLFHVTEANPLQSDILSPHSFRSKVSAPFPWFDPNLNISTRVDALIAALSLEQKAQQLTGDARAIPELGLVDYAWCSEGSHGVARAGRATVFPSPIASACAFNNWTMGQAGQVLATEARGKYNDYAAKHNGSSVIWYDLFLHPLWGRGQETFGEDPFVSGQLAVAYVKGMQNFDLDGTDSTKYVKAAATCKHFFSYGSSDQTILNQLNVTNTDLLQTYFPAFEACVTQAKARSIMCSYATINGYQACEHPVLQNVLRDEWKFDGFIQGDDGAITLIVAPNATMKAALALKAGVDMGGEYQNLPQALKEGLISEDLIDRSLRRAFSERIRMGHWDPPSMVPWSNYTLDVVDTTESRQLARQMAREGIVMLKNDGPLLPIELSKVNRIAVVGPNANRPLTLLGSQLFTDRQKQASDRDPQGDPPISAGCVLVTPYTAIAEAVTLENKRRTQSHRLDSNVTLSYNQGCDINSTKRDNFTDAISIVQKADIAILVFGIGTCVGPWGGPPADCIEAEAMDRINMGLTGVQPDLLRQLTATGTPIVLVLMAGSALKISEWVLSPSISSIMYAWYGGEEGGHALTELLFGDYSPSGKLSISFPLDESQIPLDSDYSLTAAPGRSYRYTTVVPLYSFGYGLSYTKFLYTPVANTSVVSLTVIKQEQSADASLNVSVKVSNVGSYSNMADEIVFVYVSCFPAVPPTPIQSIPRTELKAFTRVSLSPGDSITVQFSIPLSSLKLVGPDGTLQILPGIYHIFVGGSAPGSRGEYIDGEKTHRNKVLAWIPDETSQGSSCLEVGSWNSVETPISIAGGLSAALTIC